jgi:hypothetical protein
MKLTELGLKNLLENLEEERISGGSPIDGYGGYICKLTVTQNNLDPDVWYITERINDFTDSEEPCYNWFVINLAEQYFTYNDDCDNCVELSIEQLIKELRPYMKKAE